MHGESHLHQNNDGIEQTYGESFTVADVRSSLPVMFTKWLCEYEVTEHLVPRTKVYLFFLSCKYKADYWSVLNILIVLFVSLENNVGTIIKPVIFHSVSGLSILFFLITIWLLFFLHFWKCVLGNVGHYLAVLLGPMDSMVCQASLVPGQKCLPLSLL